MEVRPRYKQTEVGDIPEDWVAEPLGALGRFKNGINKAAEDFGHGSPFVNLMDVFGIPRASANTENLGLVNSTPVEQQTYELRAGDVLLVRSSVKPEGVGLTTLIPNDLPRTVFSGFLIRFRDSGQLAMDFKEHCFLSDGFRRRLIANSTVSANTNINQDALKLLQLGFPPRHEEQRAIATALSDVDALLGGLDRLIAKNRDLKQAAMQKLLTGQTRLPGFHGEWEVASLDMLTSRATGVWGKNKLDERSSHRVEIIRAGDISQDGKLIATATRYIAPEEFQKAKCALDDLVITTSGNGLGKLWWCDGRSNIAASNFVRVLHPEAAKVVGKFLYYALRTAEGLRQLQEHTATSAYPNLRPTYFSTTWIPLPRLPEQTAIAEVLSDMDAELAALEARRDKTRALKQAMMQELLTGRTRLV